MIEGCGEKASGAASRIENRFAQLRVDDLDHEAHDRSRGIELSVLTRRVPHFPQQRFIHPAKRLDVFGAVEVDVVYEVDDVPQHVAARRVVAQVAEHG